MKCFPMFSTEEWVAVAFGSLWCSCRRLPTDCCIDERSIWEQDIDFCHEGQTLGSSSNFQLSKRIYHKIKPQHLSKHALSKAFMKGGWIFNRIAKAVAVGWEASGKTTWGEGIVASWGRSTSNQLRERGNHWDVLMEKYKPATPNTKTKHKPRVR